MYKFTLEQCHAVLTQLDHTDFDYEDVQIVDSFDDARFWVFQQLFDPFTERIRIPLPNLKLNPWSVQT